jgi:hypothetical protein
MKNLLFSLFAIGVAAVAAMTATTAMLNTPQRASPEVIALTQAQAETPPASGGKPASGASGAPETPGAPAGAATGAKPAPGAADASKDAKDDEEADKDPYEGIPEEELPPDLQYSADSSVSFPTNI